MSKYEEEKVKIMGNMASSFWLRNSIRELDKKDIVDALVDVEKLHELLQLKWEGLINA